MGTINPEFQSATEGDWHHNTTFIKQPETDARCKTSSPQSRELPEDWKKGEFDDGEENRHTAEWISRLVCAALNIGSA